MKAMRLVRSGQSLELEDLQTPEPKENQLLIKVSTCGVCRTDVHIVDGELPNIKYPIIPGHQIVGRVERLGQNVSRFKVGDRVGVGWLGWTCRKCRFCQREQENLCESAKFTGKDINGGFAEYCVADADFCFRVPDRFTDITAVPLLCAGMVGFRAYKKLGDAQRIGFYGFGSSAHILLQIAKAEDKQVFVFTRKEDFEGQTLALKLGAVWTGSSYDLPPHLLDGVIIFAPVGELIPQALKVIDKGGVVVCAGIHMSNIPSFPYEYIWGERTITTVANLKRSDGEEFFQLARKIPLNLKITNFDFDNINQALADVREGKINGSAVINILANNITKI